MGRVALRELLGGVGGVDIEHIWPGFSLDVSPRKDGIWLVMRWGPVQARSRASAGSRSVTVWAYQSKQVGNDYAALDAVLRAVKDAIVGAVHYVGTDGSVVSCGDFRGYSGDLEDQGYDAIARNAEFTILCREA
jgi:hypothetical protein